MVEVVNNIFLQRTVLLKVFFFSRNKWKEGREGDTSYESVYLRALPRRFDYWDMNL
jgi:hypothetical protein